jgi:hypothetical protein
MSDALALGSDSSGVPPRFDPTFFPSARSSNAAEKVSLCAGEERRADITVLPASPLAVSGTVDVPAKDRLRTYVMLTAPESGSLRAARIDSDGKFKIPYVSPGDYTIAAVVSGAVQEGISNLPTAGTAITVSDGNVDGIILKPRSGISIRGRVRPTVANANPDFTGLQVALTPTDSQESMRGGLASVKSNGSFIIPHVPPGTYRIVIYADRQTNNRFASYYMKSAALNGADVLTNGVRVSSENSGILDIVIDSHGLTVDGLVSDSSGNPVPNAEVVLRPRGRFKDRSDMEQHGTSDIRGMYKLEGVAPGEYEIVAFTIADNLRAAMLILADQEHPQIKKISITNNATIPVELVEIDDLAMADNCEQ